VIVNKKFISPANKDLWFGVFRCRCMVDLKNYIVLH